MTCKDPSKSLELPRRRKNIEVRRCRVMRSQLSEILQHDWSTNPVRDIPCLHQCFPKPPKAFLKPPKPSKASKALKIFTLAAKASQNLSKHPKISQSLPKPSKSFKSILKHTKASQSLPKPRKAFQRLPKLSKSSQILGERHTMSQSLPKPFEASQDCPTKPPKAWQNLAKPAEPSKASQSFPKPGNTSQSLTKALQSLREQEQMESQQKNTRLLCQACIFEWENTNFP